MSIEYIWFEHLGGERIYIEDIEAYSQEKLMRFIYCFMLSNNIERLIVESGFYVGKNWLTYDLRGLKELYIIAMCERTEQVSDTLVVIEKEFCQVRRRDGKGMKDLLSLVPQKSYLCY